MINFIGSRLLFGAFLLCVIILDKRNLVFGGRIVRDIYFTTEPQDVIVVPRSNVKLKCKAIPKNRVKYKWILNGSEIKLSEVAPSQPFIYNRSSNGGKLLIRNINQAHYGTYQCVAEVFGRAIISRKASVRAPYLYQASNVAQRNITCNETCTINPPKIASFPSPTFTWEFRKNSRDDFRVIGNGSEGSSRFAVSLQGVLCNVNVSDIDQGEYRCRMVNSGCAKIQLVSNVYHIATQDGNVSNRLLGDKRKSQISVLVEPKNITVGISKTASFDCIVSGTDTVITWWKRDIHNQISTSAKYNIQFRYRLNIKHTVSEDEDWYGCLVVNGCNSVVKKAYLNVRERVYLDEFNNSQILYQGSELILKATAHHGELEWYKNGLPIDHHFLTGGPNVRNIFRETTTIGDEVIKDEQTLRFKNVKTRDGGIYQVLAKGFETQVSNNTRIIIYEPTTNPAPKPQQLSTTTTTRYETKGHVRTSQETKAATDPTTPQFTNNLHSSTEGTITVVGTTTGKHETGDSKKSSSSAGQENIVYAAIAAGVCLLVIFGIGLILIKRRKENFICNCRKENKQLRNGTEGTTQIENTDEEVYSLPLTRRDVEDAELHTYATVGEDNAVFSYNSEKNAKHRGQPAENSTNTPEQPFYDTLEPSYATAGERIRSNIPQNQDLSNIYATINCGETSLLEEIYTSLKVERDENNVYASLCKPNAADEEREISGPGSLQGMDSADQDYVVIT